MAVVAAAWAGFTGPNRTTTKDVRDPDGDYWYCKRAGFPTCNFKPGINPCLDAGGSHPSIGAQQACFGGLPADTCGCNKSYTTQTVNLPPATVGGSESCSNPGDNGWCRSGASLELSANEPLYGESVDGIEGNPGGLLCGPSGSSTLACSYSGAGEGNFTIEYWALSSYGDTSDKASSEWKVDGSPPSINLSVSGGTAGGGGWYRGGTLDVQVSGVDGISGVATAEVSVDGGGWASSAQVSGDGVHSVTGRVVDGAGNQSTDSAEIRIDGTAPSLNPELSGTKGRDGWYISPVSVFASASDNLSRIARVEVSSGAGGWQSGPLVISTDGSHQPRYRAQDIAGNETVEDGPTIKIDTHPPESAFINPPDGSETWVSGVIPLIGRSSDQTSGLLAVEISYDGGESWNPLEQSSGDWRASWDSTGLPNGTYEILGRASDVAGNRESSAKVTLRIDNEPPYVEIPESWLVSEQGTLIVEEGGIGLDGVEVVIRSGETILVIREYGEETVPEVVSWDGLLEDGTQAAPGKYPVIVVAWDLVGNIGSDSGHIVVPEAEREAASAAAPAEPAQANSGNSSSAGSETEAEDETIRPLPWIWPAIAWIGLLSAVGLAKISDPRPEALKNLHDDIMVIRSSLQNGAEDA